MELFQKWIQGLEATLHLSRVTPLKDGSIALEVDDAYALELSPLAHNRIRFQSTWVLPDASDWTESDWEALLEAQVGIFAESKAILGWNSEQNTFLFHKTLSFESYTAEELYQELEDFINQIEFWHNLTDKKGTTLPSGEYLMP